jgi:hypothetical protein
MARDNAENIVVAIEAFIDPEGGAMNGTTYTLFAYRRDPVERPRMVETTCPREALDEWEFEIGNPRTSRALVRAYSSNGRDAVTIAEWSRDRNAAPLFV